MSTNALHAVDLRAWPPASDRQAGVRNPIDPDSRIQAVPRGFLRACDRWRLHPREVLLVGYRPDVDAAGAAAAGMPCVIIGRVRSTPRSTYLPLSSVKRLHRVLDAEIAARIPARSGIWPYVQIAQADHWFKNAFMLLGVVLGMFYEPSKDRGGSILHAVLVGGVYDVARACALVSGGLHDVRRQWDRSTAVSR